MTELRTRPLQFMRDRLDVLQGQDLRRRLRTVTGGTEPWVELDGRRLLNLSSNNYLGLATHPEVAEAAARAGCDGCGAGSARLIAGSRALHETLERRLAGFKGLDSALLFNSGYTANIGIIPALAGQGDVILSDALNHASLIDGCRLSRAQRLIYPHCDLTTLEAHLAEARRRLTVDRGRILAVTESVFSMDGDPAPLAEIAALCARYEAMLLVDEAHGTGCLGPGGRGLVAELGLEQAVTVTMSTLGKALGSFGAFAAAEGLVTEYLVNVARSFIFSTALPPPVVAASLAALTVLEREPERVARLQANGALLRRSLQGLGFDTLRSETHIVPVLVGEAHLALMLADALRQRGVFAVAIRPPTVPAGMARLRLSVMATHSRDDLLWAAETIRQAADDVAPGLREARHAGAHHSPPEQNGRGR